VSPPSCSETRNDYGQRTGWIPCHCRTLTSYKISSLGCHNDHNTCTFDACTGSPYLEFFRGGIFETGPMTMFTDYIQAFKYFNGTEDCQSELPSTFDKTHLDSYMTFGCFCFNNEVAPPATHYFQEL
jgi:hypothetical protein